MRKHKVKTTEQGWVFNGVDSYMDTEVPPPSTYLEDTFYITLRNNYFVKGDTYFDQDYKPYLVVDVPTPQYKKWYWRILYYLSFKTRFEYKISYTIRAIEK